MIWLCVTPATFPSGREWRHWRATVFAGLPPLPMGEGRGEGKRVAPAFPHACPSPQPSPQRGEGVRRRLPLRASLVRHGFSNSWGWRSEGRPLQRSSPYPLSLWERAGVRASAWHQRFLTLAPHPHPSPKGRESRNEVVSLLLPLPLGEARGEGSEWRQRFLMLAPHPTLSPKGRGSQKKIENLSCVALRAPGPPSHRLVPGCSSGRRTRRVARA